MRKNLITIFAIFLIGNVIKAQQSTFCDGFENGFKKGKKYLNERSYIFPICPVVSSAQDNYEYGYSVGYGKAIGKEVLSISESNKNGTFESGFKNGYELVMTQHKKANFIFPITPIAPMNGDDYETGYLLGIKKAYEKLKISQSNNTVIVDDSKNNESEKTKTFCNGWEEGYKVGLKHWATENRKSVPLKLTPICPIAKINQDTYQHGFNLGIEKAKNDCNK